MGHGRLWAMGYGPWAIGPIEARAATTATTAAAALPPLPPPSPACRLPTMQRRIGPRDPARSPAQAARLSGDPGPVLKPEPQARARQPAALPGALGPSLPPTAPSRLKTQDSSTHNLLAMQPNDMDVSLACRMRPWHAASWASQQCGRHAADFQIPEKDDLTFLTQVTVALSDSCS